MIRVVGVGAGAHARVLLEILQQQIGVCVEALVDVDPSRHGTSVMGVPVIGGDDQLPGLLIQGVSHAFIGVGSTGDARVRVFIYDHLLSLGFSLITIQHPRAIISPSAIAGSGCAYLASAIVNSHARLGTNVLVNTAAIVEHDCMVDDHAHIAPGAILAGGVHVGRGAHIGLGAVVRQGLSVGEGAVVGAGAAVIRDVSPFTVVAGVPAVPIRELSP